MQVVSLAQCAEQPWKNGGGSTRELLAWPDAGDWALRLSVARIGCDGPFSAYGGVSRWFAVLSGGGVELSWPGRTLRLPPGADAVEFDGQHAPDCRLLGSATEDLNLMLRQDRAEGRLLSADQPWHAPAGWRGVYTTTPCELHAAQALKLPAHSLAWDDEAEDGTWHLQAADAPRAWWIDVELLPT